MADTVDLGRAKALVNQFADEDACEGKTLSGRLLPEYPWQDDLPPEAQFTELRRGVAIAREAVHVTAGEQLRTLLHSHVGPSIEECESVALSIPETPPQALANLPQYPPSFHSHLQFQAAELAVSLQHRETLTLSGSVYLA